MANFKTHYQAGLGGGLIATFPLTFYFDFSFLQNAIALLVCTTGALAPDIDLPTSRPAKWLLGYLALGCSAMAFWRFGDEIWGIWVAIAMMPIGYACGYFGLKFLTFHRGFVHSIPCGLSIGLWGAVGLQYCWGYELVQVLIWGGIFVYGYLIHLILDEVYSVDLLGMRIKRSFGSALKLWEYKEPFKSLGLYALIGLALIELCRPSLEIF